MLGSRPSRSLSEPIIDVQGHTPSNQSSRSSSRAVSPAPRPRTQSQLEVVAEGLKAHADYQEKELRERAPDTRMTLPPTFPDPDYDQELGGLPDPSNWYETEIPEPLRIKTPIPTMPTQLTRQEALDNAELKVIRGITSHIRESEELALILEDGVAHAIGIFNYQPNSHHTQTTNILPIPTTISARSHTQPPTNPQSTSLTRTLT